MSTAQDRASLLTKIGRLLAETRIGTTALDSRAYSSICTELRLVQLPINSTQKADYLSQERDLLLTILSDYQIEFKAYSLSRHHA